MRAGRVEEGRDLDSVTHRHEHPRERRPTDSGSSNLTGHAVPAW
jgi:hypothetical protein